MNNRNSTVIIRRKRSQRGQALVELSLALPIFLVLVMGIIDFGWGLTSWINMTNAAREAGRYGAVHCSDGTATTSDVQNRAISAASAISLNTGDVSVSNCATEKSGESMVVSIEYDYKLVTPLSSLLKLLGGGLGSTITLTTSTDMRLE